MKHRLLILSSLPLLLLAFVTPTWADDFARSNQVVIAINYGSLDLTRLHRLEDELDLVAKETKSGELDGDEVTPDGRNASIYLKSVDANRLIKAIGLTLKAHDFSRDAQISVGS